MSRKLISTREDALAFLAKMCNPEKEDLTKFIDAIDKTGCYGLGHEEIQLLRECTFELFDKYAHEVFLEEE